MLQSSSPGGTSFTGDALVAGEARPVAFVVDDDLLVRQAFADCLGSAYDVQPFESGEAALLALPGAWPDVVLLDLVLPGLDGTEVCRRMKASAAGRPLAVVLVTGLEVLDVEGLAREAGADDVLLKPVTRSRLREHLDILARLVASRRQHAAALVRLQEVEGQLQQAQRLATLGTFARGIGHEMNNVGTVLKSGLEELCRGQAVDRELVEELQLAAAQLQGLAGAVQRLAAPSLTQVVLDVRTVVRDVVSLARLTGRTKYLAVEVDVPPAPVLAALSPAHAQQVVLAVLLSAADAVATLPSGKLHVVLRAEQGEVRIAVEDNGPGLDPGPSLDPARRLVHSWGGRLEVKRRLGAGTQALVSFPAELSARAT
jgi:CheY-like chemotaxis protein